MLGALRSHLLGPREVWRILREMDLEAVRREAERPFRVAVVAEAEPDALALAAELTGAGGPRHPWLLPTAPLQVRALLAAQPCDAALVLTPLPDLEPALASAVEALHRAGVPVVTVVMGGSSPVAGVLRSGEAARVVIGGLEAKDVASVAEALVAAVATDRRLALARHLPPLRRPVFALLIDETAKANALYALSAGLAEIVPVLDVPLNLADVIVLTKNQLVMSYRIALAAGKQGTPRHLIGEVVGVVGGGFLLRQAARELVGLIPVVGILPKVAVAYAGTWALGRAVAGWASEGHRLSRRSMKQLYGEARARGRALAATLVDHARTLPRAPRRFRLRRGTAAGA